MPPIEHALLSHIEQVAEARGMAADGGVRARAVAALSETYTRRRERVGALPGDAATLLPRLVFFLPRDMGRVQVPLGELRDAGALPEGRRWRVLDLGAGLGATSLGTALFAAEHGLVDALSVTAVDHDGRALGLLRDVLGCPPTVGLPPIRLTPRTADATSLDPSAVDGPFDLILAGLVLNELWGPRFDEDDAAVWLRRWTDALAPDGSLIVIEPALREPTRRLMRLRDRLAGAHGPPTVFAPCLRSGPCPMLANARDWCHTDLPGRLPEGVAELAAAAGLREQRRTLAYLTLRRDGRRLVDAVRPHGGQPYRVVSGRLGSKGKCERVGCGEGGLVRWTRLDRHAGPATEDWDHAHRGDVVLCERERANGPQSRLGPEAQVRRWPPSSHRD
jgi:SAM-dependent methyltransferase